MRQCRRLDSCIPRPNRITRIPLLALRTPTPPCSPPLSTPRAHPHDPPQAIYNSHQSTHSGGGGVFEEAGGYAMVDTLFSLAEAYLYMQLVDMKDGSAAAAGGWVGGREAGGRWK